MTNTLLYLQIVALAIVFDEIVLVSFLIPISVGMYWFLKTYEELMRASRQAPAANFFWNNGEV